MDSQFQKLFLQLRTTVWKFKESLDAVKIDTYLVACYFANLELKPKEDVSFSIDGWVAHAPVDVIPATIYDLAFMKGTETVRFHRWCTSILTHN